MKLSEITIGTAAGYLRFEDGEYDENLLTAVMQAARSYIEHYTGLSATELDRYEDVSIAFLVLCQDLYDNRTMYPDTRYAANANRVVSSILDLHARNLL